MKKLQSEVLENRALLSAVSCFTEESFAVACNVNTGFPLATGNIITLAQNTVGAAATDGMLLSSTWDDTAHFKVKYTGGKLFVAESAGTPSVEVGSCNVVAGASGDHETPLTFGVCKFLAGEAISGSKSPNGAAFTADVLFPLVTKTPLTVTGSNDGKTLLGEVILKGPLKVTVSIDPESVLISGMTTVNVAWTPTITSAGTAGVSPLDPLTFAAGAITSSVTGSSTTSVPHSNIAWDMMKDPATGANPRQVLRDKIDALYPL